jgi:hypothetical protein
VQPTLTILRNGEVVASRPNTEGTLTTSLRTLLGPGSYVVQVGTVNGAAGLVIVVLQNEVPVPTAPLTPGVPVNTVVGPQVPLVIYTFTSLSDPAFLYVDGESAEEGVSIHIVNTTTGQTSAQVEADLLGVRFRIKPGANSYQVEIHGGDTPETFTICLSAINMAGCEIGSVAIPATAIQIPTLVPTASAACTVTPAAAGGVNVRQSASTTSLIIGRLSDGTSATVTGISPDRTFYNVIYDNRDGWIAASVVVANGDCANVPVVTPPPIIPQPTAVPPTPVPPTAPPPQPTQDNGPCLITITGEMLVYGNTEAIPDYIYDEVQPGYQLIPTGKLADNSWWQTNYAGAWIQTSAFGNTATVSGNCFALPVVPPPEPGV